MNPNPNPSEMDDLLAAWALDALDPVERAAIDRLVASDPSVAETAYEMQRTVAALDANLRAAPPSSLGLRILHEAGSRPPTLAEPSPAVDLLSHQVAALADLLDQLNPHDWRLTAHPYEWTVHGLVAHLAVIEQYTAAVLGLGVDAPLGEDHLHIGADRIARLLESPPDVTVEDWRLGAERIVEAIRAGQGPTLDTVVSFHQWSISVEGLLIVRAFETWTHADDIRRAAGRQLWTPEASDLRTMSAFSVSTLPFLLADVAPDALHNARVVLTGDGGGTFNLGDRAIDPEGSQFTLVTDVLDYCHRVAGRVEPEDLVFSVEGDLDLARQLLSVASAFAV